MADAPKPSYRWAAWSHWANLTFLAAGGLAGATIDPAIWLAMLPIEASVLWMLPDVPTFRRSIDARSERAQLQQEREYYLEQLWGVRPRRRGLGQRFKELFVTTEIDDVDERVIQRTGDFDRYREMRDILQRLRGMVPLSRARITEQDVLRLEHVVVSYLRLLFACRPLGKAVSELNESALERELKDIAQRMQGADNALRPVLLERKRLLETQLQRAPKLRATLELMRARAEAIPYQLRNLHSSLLTDPGSDAHAMLDDMIERNDMLADPLGDLSADEAVRDLVRGGVSDNAKRAQAAQVAGKR